MGKWAYNVVIVKFDPRDLLKRLNELGKEGWELVSIDRIAGNAWLFLKSRDQKS